VQQEIWTQLTVCQALRRAMTDAVESVPGTDPDRAAFTVALETARDQLIAADGVLPGAGQPGCGRIGRAILENLLPARRPWTAPRRVKCPIFPLRDPAGRAAPARHRASPRSASPSADWPGQATRQAASF
jgi:hypothetical protein